MRFVIRKLFVLLMVVPAFFGCSKEEGAGAGGNSSDRTVRKENLSYTIKDDVRILSSENSLETYTVESENCLILNNCLSVPQKGDIYVSMSASDSAPHGFAGRVTKVTQRGAETLIYTEAVPLEDIFTRYTQKETYDISQQEFYSPDGQLLTGGIRQEDVKGRGEIKTKMVPIDFTKDLGNNFKFKFTGSLTVGGDVSLEYDLEKGYFNLTPQVYSKLEVDFSISGKAKTGFKDTKVLLGLIPLSTAGIVSINLEVYAYFTLEGELKIQSGICIEATEGFEWVIKDGVSTIKEIEPDVNDSDPFSSELAVEGTIGAGIGLREAVGMSIFQYSVFSSATDDGGLYLDEKLQIKGKSGLSTEDEPLNYVDGIPYKLLYNSSLNVSLNAGVYFECEIENFFTNKLLKDGRISINWDSTINFDLVTLYIFPTFDNWFSSVDYSAGKASVSYQLHRDLILPVRNGAILKTKDTGETIRTYENPLEYHLDDDTVPSGYVTISFENLAPGTKYELYPYAVIFGKVILSDTPYCFSLEDSLDILDLGLSVKWSTCNIGAGDPYDAGAYYAWGEISGKSTYEWSNYIWSGNGRKDGIFKYCSGDSLSVLSSRDDIASLNLGGQWRIPSAAEFKELAEGCDWKYDASFGGYTGTSRKNGAQIILPAGGSFEDGSILGDKSEGKYWTLDLSSSDSGKAYCFTAKSATLSECLRCYGLMIRPVYGARPNGKIGGGGSGYGGGNDDGLNGKGSGYGDGSNGGDGDGGVEGGGNGYDNGGNGDISAGGNGYN